MTALVAGDGEVAAIAAMELGERLAAAHPRFSVCTLVSDRGQYQEMLASFAAAGFDCDSSEFLYVDNTRANRYDAFEAANLFLTVAAGDYIIICHQDIRLHDHRRVDLERAIAAVSALDANWGVLGNAGGVAPGILAVRISDPHGVDTRRGTFPARVQSLDENFIVVRRTANLAVSRDIGGFHLYATDICIVAEVLGYSCYVVDFHLLHLGGASSGGAPDKVRTSAFGKDYPRARARLIRKYRRAFASRWLQNTGTLFLLSSSPLFGLLAESKLLRSLVKRFTRLRRATRARA